MSDTDAQGSKPKGPEVIVKGGTATSQSEALYKRRYHEAEHRRDVADAERRVASIPTKKGGAKLLTNQMTRHPEIPKAYILLTYVDRYGQEVVINGETVQCCADLIVGMNPLFPTELTLILVCPRCSQGQKHLQDCQIQLRQTNKNFVLQTGKGDPTFRFQGQLFKSAGVIVESEPGKCPDCDWRFRIVNNTVRPD